MTIIVCGLNHKTASLNLREKFYFVEEKLPFYLKDLLSLGLASEAVLLSTCNRSELYCDARDPHAIKAWFLQQGLSAEEADAAIYLHEDEAAVAHIMAVACGLDSMVLGEPEIFGQVKKAFAESCTVGAVGSLFNRLFQQIFMVAKEIRTTTAIGACPVSVASMAITLAKRLADFPTAKIVLLGAGDMVDLILRYLHVSPVKEVVLVNRNYEKAVQLSRTYGCQPLPLTELADALQDADLLVTATGSFEPLITAAFLERALADKTKPLFIFDIAVPRDVEAEASALPQVELYCIDDLKAIIQENFQGRQHAALKAQELVAQKSAAFMANLASQNQVTDTIRAYREQIEGVCALELEKALRLLSKSQDPETVLRQFATAVTNKLLHAPSVQLRQAGADGRLDLLQLAKQLLAIPELSTAKAL